MEVWKDIAGYEGLYQVSNLGRVRSFGRYVKNRSKLVYKPEKLLQPAKDSYGYFVVGLCKNGKAKNFKVHRLVAQTFMHNPENKETVNHINGNKEDNRAENLEFCTNEENLQHAFSLGLTGGEHFKNNKRSTAVAQYDKNMRLVKTYPSIREAERQTGVHNQSIVKCCKGKVKTAGGYVWKYA